MTIQTERYLWSAETPPKCLNCRTRPLRWSIKTNICLLYLCDHCILEIHQATAKPALDKAFERAVHQKAAENATKRKWEIGGSE